MLCRVVAIRRLEPDRFDVTLDSSYLCHARWARLEWREPAGLDAERCEFDSVPPVGMDQQVLHFTGASCAERDIIGIYRFRKQGRFPVSVGDVLTFANLHGYAYAWNTSFNGVPKADVRFV